MAVEMHRSTEMRSRQRPGQQPERTRPATCTGRSAASSRRGCPPPAGASGCPAAPPMHIRCAPTVSSKARAERRRGMTHQTGENIADNGNGRDPAYPVPTVAKEPHQSSSRGWCQGRQLPPSLVLGVLQKSPPWCPGSPACTYHSAQLQSPPGRLLATRTDQPAIRSWRRMTMGSSIRRTLMGFAGMSLELGGIGPSGPRGGFFHWSGPGTRSMPRG